MVTNYELKRDARDALLDRWPTAILVVLITMLLSLLSQMYNVLIGVDSTQQLLQFVADMMHGRSFRQALVTLLLSDSADLPFNLFDIASFIIMPMLSMGCNDFMMKRLSGDESAGLDTVLSHKDYFWPALKLSLLTTLRTLGWVLPGFILMLIGGGQSGNSAGNLGFGLLLLLGGLTLVCVLERWAGYRYGMSLYFLTENPEMDAKACIQASLDMMAHRKMQLFTLDLSFILFDLGILAVQVVLAVMLGSVTSALVGIALHLPVKTYREAAFAAFYLTFSPEKETNMVEVNDHGNEL